MSLQTITPEMAEGPRLARDHGVIISDVWPRGPAEAAGLKPGTSWCRWMASRPRTFQR